MTLSTNLVKQLEFIVICSVVVLCFFWTTVLPAQDQDIQIEDLSGILGSQQITVDREQGQYLGHPTTCLLDDGKTILAVYPKGHGKGPIVYRRSTDGGMTWSDRLKTPENWKTSKETPTLHRVTGPDRRKRIIMFSGLYPARMAVSEDDGQSWSELKKIGDWGGIVVMGSVVELKTGPGHYLAMFHDDGRFISAGSKQQSPIVFTVYRTNSTDGGMTWSTPIAVTSSSEKHICEPGVIRSPTGDQLACLLRENSRRYNSQIIFSNDEGKTWTKPRDLPKWLCGDRHTGKYLKDGRLFISYRCRWPQVAGKTDFEGDWVAWMGTYEDLVEGKVGEKLFRLKDNLKNADCAYPGVEVLPADGTVVTTTYGHWIEDEQPFIVAIRLKFPLADETEK